MRKKKYKIVSEFPTSLTEKDLTRIQDIVIKYLKANDFVTNRLLREVIDITYDQAIYFYRKMLEREILKKIGTASGTRYIMNANKRK